MLYKSILKPRAKELFDLLCDSPELDGLTLIGGTALALQTGHRVSLDFDFAQFGGILPGFRIDQLLARLKREGCKTQQITTSSEISQFKINSGKNLLDYVRDYVINGVKVTFFVHGKNDCQYEYYQSATKIKEPGMNFDILGIEGLKVAKTLVLADRVRSRDLYDLYVLMRDYDYSMSSLETVVKELATLDDIEHYKAIMRREIPLDKDDEGLEAVGLESDPEKMYDFFNEMINKYEVNLAREHFLHKDNPKGHGIS